MDVRKIFVFILRRGVSYVVNLFLFFVTDIKFSILCYILVRKTLVFIKILKHLQIYSHMYQTFVFFIRIINFLV